MKACFTDFDGVLITPSAPKGDAACVAQLNRILLATDARIVVSSTWDDSWLRFTKVPDTFRVGDALFRPLGDGTWERVN